MDDGPLLVEVQLATNDDAMPDDVDWPRWANAAATAAMNGSRASTQAPMNLTIRLVSQEESQQLNAKFRHKNGPTNVLAFAGTEVSQSQAETEKVLGDLVLCVPVACTEAAEQGKNLASHMAHLTVHGTLHLFGYDHDDEPSAERMESLEISILAGLGYPDPYVA